MSDREIMNAKQGLPVNWRPTNEVTTPKPNEFARWLLQTLDMEAEEMFGEFGFDTLTEEEKLQVIAEIYSKGYFDGL